MTELLAPAGNMEALKAAIANGCDAVYLGMEKFGARAYSCNFNPDTIKEAVEYAHLRNVKVYVTMNTIVFEDEIHDMKEQLKLLNSIGVDSIIIQDLAVFDYITKHFPDMEAHCSTQMGIDDIDGAMLFKEMGASRVVLAREVDIDKVNEIKNAVNIPIEVFVHGALCVSYSGNCLMSGLIGYRSGNRGRCVGSCRKPYELINKTSGKSLGTSYILSTKDLKTIENIDKLKSIDSLKIEGRMKEPAYVANVVSKYRTALDMGSEAANTEELNKTFNRTYTKGYIFGEDKKDITNIDKPNNYGYEIGVISAANKGKYQITLSRPLNQNDIIRIDRGGEDVNLSVVKLYGLDGKLISTSSDKCYIQIKEKLQVGDIVYKTKDYHFYKLLDNKLEGEFRRFPLNFKVYAYPESALVVEGFGLGQHFVYESEEILSQARNNPTSHEQVTKQLGKLNDTIFELGIVEFEEYNAFIPVKALNNARREIVQALYNQKIASFAHREIESEKETPIVFEHKKPYLTATVSTKEQYDICRQYGIENVYFSNIIRRNEVNYEPMEGELLIGGYGGIHYYKDTNEFVTDYSLNVVNASSCYQLHKLGAKRITLSYELNKKQLKELQESYLKSNGGYPALEMIVYGRAPLMFTTYCPLKKMGQCGQCEKNSYVIKDEYGEFPVVSHDDCTVTILNGKVLNLLDEMQSIEGVEAFRLNFTTESGQEVAKVINAAMGKLNGSYTKPVFNQDTDTRGHYNKEII